MTTKARELAKLVDDSGNVDVTGTVTSDGLTVDGVAEFSGGSPQFRLTETDTTDLNNIVRVIGGNLRIESSSDDYATNKKRILVDNSTGDVSFYEDTGTTAKMVWDASAEELEIGSSTDKLELGASFQRFRKGNENKILIGNTSSALGSGTGLINYLYDPEPFIWYQGAERMRIDSSGNVGIGESDPSGYWSQANHLVINDGNTGITIKSSSVGNGRLVFTDTKSTTSGLSDGGMITYGHATDVMTFQTAGTERARIDSSGNLLVGTTTSPTNNLSSGNVVGDIFSSSSHTVSDVGSTFVDSGFSVGNTRASYLVTISGGAPNNGSALATYIFTKAAYDAELVQLGNTASHYGNVSIEAQRSSSSSSTVNLQVRFTGVNLTGTGPITTNAIRIG